MNSYSIAQFFDTAGYYKLRKAISCRMVHEMRTFIIGQFRQAIPPLRVNSVGMIARIDSLLQRHPMFLEALRSKRVLEVIRTLLGPDVEVLHNRNNHAALNRPGDMEFRLHRDIQQWSQSMVTMFFYLEDSTLENGCTHLVPTSHRLPYAGIQSGDGGGNWVDEHAEYGHVIEQALPIPASAGDVLFFNNLAFHTAGTHSSNRTRISCAFACRAIDNLRKFYDAEAGTVLCGAHKFKGNSVLPVSGALINPDL